MKRYFPVLLSKAGELAALSNHTQHVKNEFAPIIQVLPENYDRVEVLGSNSVGFSNRAERRMCSFILLATGQLL